VLLGTDEAPGGFGSPLWTLIDHQSVNSWYLLIGI